MSIWYPCIYCTEDLKCTKYSGDGVISFCVLGPCHDETPSNADRIRAMTDEDLANEIAKYVACNHCKIEAWCDCERSFSECRSGWLEWLRKEAEDD